MKDIIIEPATKTLISGGIEISSFEDDELNGVKCVSADLSEFGELKFTDFYVGGKAALVPRYPKEEVLNAETVENVDETNTANGLIDSLVWQEILNELSVTSPLLRGILEGSKAYLDGDYCLIDSLNTQFAELMNQKSGLHRDKLRRAVETVLGKTYKLGPYRKKAASNPDDALESLKNKLKELEVPGNR